MSSVMRSLHTQSLSRQHTKSNLRPKKMAVILHFALLSVGAHFIAPAAMAAESGTSVQQYNISGGTLSQVLVAFASQSGILLSVDGKLTSGKTSNGLHGSYNIDQGLNALLTGSGLMAKRAADGNYLVEVAPAGAASVAGKKSETTLPTLTVVGDWLGSAEQAMVFEHPGARDVIRREQIDEQGATRVRDVLNRIPGVYAPENNGTGGQDLALNVGIRGLNPRLASRSTILMDGIPVPFAPYGQPQLSLAPVSLGNMDAVDVVRGGGAVRYGPQNVGGIINFVTKAIPKDYTAKVNVQTEMSSHSSNNGKTTADAIIGGTTDNGLGGAVLYSGVRGSDWRDHSGTTIDDVILKGNYQIDATQKVTGMIQHYEGRADMPGGLSVADYAKDPFQSTRPYDSFWGRRTLVTAGYSYTPDATKEFTVNAFYTSTLRSGYLEQGSNITLSPRRYWVKGIETHYSQAFNLGQVHHEIGVGHRYINEQSNELRYKASTSLGILPTEASPYDRDTRGGTNANAFYLDDRIDVGNWTITPGIRYEMIRSRQMDNFNHLRYQGDYNTALPALNVLYHMNNAWNIYANTEGSFGAIQYSQMTQAVKDGNITPEKARTWEVGTRYDDGDLQAEIGAFLINFNNQYDSNQQTGEVIVRGKTRHQGIESSLAYNLGAFDERLRGLKTYLNYTFVDATIRNGVANYGNQVPFSPKQKALLGVSYQTGQWTWDGHAQLMSSQYADNANTEAESTDGSKGKIPGYSVFGVSGRYQFGTKATSPAIGVGIDNVFDRRYFTRSDDNNKGKYVGEPRTVYIRLSAGF